MELKKIIKDLKNFVIYKKNEKNYHSVYFTENNYTFSYLSENFNEQRRKKKLALVSLQKFNNNFLNDFYVFESSLFRQIFFLSVKVKYFYSTTPDLSQSIFTKSVYNQTKYIYLQHSPVGLTHKYRDKAFNAFDAIQVINTFQYADIIKIKKKHNLKVKILKSRYKFLNFLKKKPTTNFGKSILVAPTWNTDFYDNNLHEIIIKNLKKYQEKTFFRPHPMSIKNKEVSFIDLTKLGYKIDKNDTLNINDYTHLITDWSGIYIEYAIIKNNKPFLLNTNNKNAKSMKTNNNDAFEYFSRDLIGNLIDIQSINKIEDLIDLNNSEKNKIYITNYFKKYFY